MLSFESDAVPPVNILRSRGMVDLVCVLWFFSGFQCYDQYRRAVCAGKQTQLLFQFV